MTPTTPVNPYYARELSDEAIAAREHRQLVGGMWDEIGVLQFAFLRKMGLIPGERLLDVGCGALRGGIHFIRYLERANYYGLDINASLIKAGQHELDDAGLNGKDPHFAVSQSFDVLAFGTTFRYAIAISLFSHLPRMLIAACLGNVRQVLEPDGRFFASYWEAPTSAHREPIKRESGFVTYHDAAEADSYHYSWEEIRHVAESAELAAERIGDWGHPRGQTMACFRHRED